MVYNFIENRHINCNLFSSRECSYPSKCAKLQNGFSKLAKDSRLIYENSTLPSLVDADIVSKIFKNFLQVFQNADKKANKKMTYSKKITLKETITYFYTGGVLSGQPPFVNKELINKVNSIIPLLHQLSKETEFRKSVITNN